MEEIREEFTCVEDYSISETSLEQVFISFAKNQISTEKISKSTKTEDPKYDESDATIEARQTKLVRHLSTISRVSEKIDADKDSQDGILPVSTNSDQVAHMWYHDIILQIDIDDYLVFYTIMNDTWILEINKMELLFLLEWYSLGFFAWIERPCMKLNYWIIEWILFIVKNHFKCIDFRYMHQKRNASRYNRTIIIIQSAIGYYIEFERKEI